MMSYTRSLLVFIFSLFLIIIALVLFFSSNSKTNSQYNNDLNKFANYSLTSATATLDINGPITAQSTHNEVKIIVSNLDVNLQVLKGYDGEIILNQVFSNSQNSYNAFLRSIYLNGFTLKTNKNIVKNSIGLCATGDVYNLELLLNSSYIVNSWETNCGGSNDNFAGNLTEIIDLFESQVPNYNSYTNNLNI